MTFISKQHAGLLAALATGGALSIGAAGLLGAGKSKESIATAPSSQRSDINLSDETLWQQPNVVIVKESSKSSDALAWAEHFSNRQLASEQIAHAERLAQKQAQADFHNSLEGSFQHQTDGFYASVGRTDTLSLALASLGNGAQSASWRISAAALDAAKQIEIKNIGSLESVMLKGIDERVEVGKMVMSGVTKTPMMPSKLSNPSSSNATPPPAANLSGSGESNAPAVKEIHKSAPKSTSPIASKTAAPEVKAHADSGGGKPIESLMQTGGEKVAPKGTGWLVGPVVDEIVATSPELGRVSCYGSSYLGRTVDAFKCGFMAPTGEQVYSPLAIKQLEAQQDCNAIGGIRLQQRLEACDQQYQDALKDEAQRQKLLESMKLEEAKRKDGNSR